MRHDLIISCEFTEPHRSRREGCGPLSWPGVDPHASYVTSLAKTSVEIVNVQLLAGAAREIRLHGVGDLLVAMTDVHLLRELKDAESREIQLSKGEVKWLLGGTTASFQECGWGARAICNS
jgi:hypothetical protein